MAARKGQRNGGYKPETEPSKLKIEQQREEEHRRGLFSSCLSLLGSRSMHTVNKRQWCNVEIMMPKWQMRCFYLFIFCTLTFQLNMEMETNVIFHHAVVTGLQNVLLISQTGLKGHILGQTVELSYWRPHNLFYKHSKTWCLRAF